MNLDPVSDKPYRPTCEKCVYYTMIDSGYGWCRRFPPVLRYEGFFRVRFVYEYPIVAWTQIACGELRGQMEIRANINKEKPK